MTKDHSEPRCWWRTEQGTFLSGDPDCRAGPRRRTRQVGTLPVMEDRGVVCENHPGDVPSAEKSLQGRWRQRLGLVQPPESDSRDASTTLLQGGQELLHLGAGLTQGGAPPGVGVQG